MRIVVLGGAGMMGSIAVQDLANSEGVDEIVIGDRDVVAAEKVAAIVNSPNLSWSQVDVRDREELVSLLRGADACLNATVYYTNLPIMEACLEAGVSYTDMGGLFHTTFKQLELSGRFADKGISAVLGMGSAPGLPNIHTRYAAERLDAIDYVRIYDGIKPPPPDDVRFTYAVPTILDELTLEPMAYENGEFVAKQPLSGFEDYWFSPPLGLLPMHYSLHSEVATIPITYRDKGIQECFFKINYWGMAKDTVDKINILAEFGLASHDPVEVNGMEVVPRQLLVNLMDSYVPPITDFLAPPKNTPPDWVKEIVTEIKGRREGGEVIYRMGTLTVKGALPTGVAPAIAAVWLAQGRIPPGVYPPEAVLEPRDFFQELEAYDIVTRVTETRKA